MIEALKELGHMKLLAQGQNTDDRVSILMRNPNQTGRYPKLIEIVLEKKGEEWRYSGCQVSDFQTAHLDRYMYRDGSSRGVNFIPGAIITESDKTIKGKILLWFKQYEQGKLSIKNDHERILGWARAVELQQKQIIEDVAEKFENLDGAIAIVCEKDSSIKYPGDFSEFRDTFLEFFLGKINQTERHGATCGVCGKSEKTVYGQALSQHFKFYTLDKPGYIAGGFDKDSAAKNAPVCLDCFLKVEEGIDFILNNLTRTLGGQTHWLIPKFYGQIDAENAEDVIGLLKDIQTLDKNGKVTDTVNYQALRNWQTIQYEIPDALIKEEFPVSYNFFFFDKQTGKQIPNKIKLLLQDVHPTRLREIRESATRAKLTLSNGQEINFGFGILLDFAQEPKRTTKQDENRKSRKKPSDRTFLEVVEHIFRNHQIERLQTFNWIMRYLRTQRRLADELRAKGEREDAEKHEREFHYATIRAVVLLNFLQIHGVLKANEFEGGHLVTDYSANAEAYFEQNSNVYSTPIHKALFLLGVFTNRVLYVQREVMKNEPFWNVLKDLKMQERDFVALLPKIQSKLKQYDRPFKNEKGYLASSPRYASLVSDYLQSSPRPWNLSTDEMNYYFTLGLNLAFDFNKAVFPKEETDKEIKDAAA